MQPGDTIQILPSYALMDLHLEELVGIRAEVVEVKYKNGQVYGCWVQLPDPYLEEYEWFIPYISIGQ